MAVFGNIPVYYPEETNPNAGGGPIRRSGGVVTRSRDGMPPNGWPQMVLRTPHAVVRDAEPGGAEYPGITDMKFLPDGRLVPGGALGEFGGVLDPVRGLFALGATPEMGFGGVAGGAVLGALAGALLAPAGGLKARAGWGALLGAGVGAWLTVMLGQTASLSATRTGYVMQNMGLTKK